MQHIDIQPSASGKVRDIYDLGDKMLLVATDRISAFDYILPDEIPYKGEILTRISVFWLEQLKDIVRNHLVSTDIKDLPKQFALYKDYLSGRFMIVDKVQMFPIECIVRGYLTGSGLKEYNKTGKICDISLPQGLQNASKLSQAIFTPSSKAQVGDHDENISFEQCSDLIGREYAQKVRDLSFAIYEQAHDYALSRGIIIADTKFEFGLIDGEIILADEVLTPDSSRFWPADQYEIGRSQMSFDKQYVRDWLEAHWDKKQAPPSLPSDVIKKTSEKYIQAYEIITGQKFEPICDYRVD